MAIERRPFKRVLIKLSGEALAGSRGFGLDNGTLSYIAQEIGKVRENDVQVAVVVGGGNFFRGDQFTQGGGIDRTAADQMGMLGTIMNALALQSALEKNGLIVRVQSAIGISEVAEPFIQRRAIRHLEKGRTVVFAAGTGNPYFTTDTAAVLRALEIDAECLIKATKVDGIYDKDPKKFDGASRFEELSFSKAIGLNLAVMDRTAFTMCQEYSLPIIVLDFNESNILARAVRGEKVGTFVGGE